MESKIALSEIKAPAKPVLKGVSKRTSALSLKSIHQKPTGTAQEEEKTIDRANLAKDPCSASKLQDLWIHYASELHASGIKNLSAILTASTPNIDDCEIQVTLPSKFMADQLDQARPKLLKHLRTKANNFHLTLKIEIDDREEKKFIYTPEEKFEKLKEQNPHMELLRQRFKLDV